MSEPLAACTAVILAGGRGTRIADLYPNLPKPLIPAAGRPFLHWVTAWIAAQDITSVVYSTGYLGEQIEDWMACSSDFPALRRSCCREAQPLGTGGAVIACLPQCGPWLLVLNGDSLILTELAQAIANCIASGCDGMLLGTPVDDAARYGALHVDSQGLLAGFHEKQPGNGLINAGVYLLRAALLADLPSGVPMSIEREVLPRMISSGARLQVRSVAAPFLDIGTPETAGKASDFIASNQAAFARTA